MNPIMKLKAKIEVKAKSNKGMTLVSLLVGIVLSVITVVILVHAAQIWMMQMSRLEFYSQVVKTKEKLRRIVNCEGINQHLDRNDPNLCVNQGTYISIYDKSGNEIVEKYDALTRAAKPFAFNIQLRARCEPCGVVSGGFNPRIGSQGNCFDSSRGVFLIEYAIFKADNQNFALNPVNGKPYSWKNLFPTYPFFCLPAIKW